MKNWKLNLRVITGLTTTLALATAIGCGHPEEDTTAAAPAKQISNPVQQATSPAEESQALLPEDFGSRVAVTDGRFKATLDILIAESTRVNSLLASSQGAVDADLKINPFAALVDPAAEDKSVTNSMNGLKTLSIDLEGKNEAGETIVESRELDQEFGDEMSKGVHSDATISKAVARRLKEYDEARKTLSKYREFAFAQPFKKTDKLSQLDVIQAKKAEIDMAFNSINKKEAAFIQLMLELATEANN